jgi:hypothetical protein
VIPPADPAFKIKILKMVVDGERLDLSEELSFHGIEYIISLSVVEGPVLVVDVEQVCNYRYDCSGARYSADLVTFFRSTTGKDGMGSLAPIILKRLHTKRAISKSFQFSPRCLPPHYDRCLRLELIWASRSPIYD